MHTPPKLLPPPPPPPQRPGPQCRNSTACGVAFACSTPHDHLPAHVTGSACLSAACLFGSVPHRSLGVAAGRIQITGLSRGSVIVEFEIEEEEGGSGAGGGATALTAATFSTSALTSFVGDGTRVDCMSVRGSQMPQTECARLSSSAPLSTSVVPPTLVWPDDTPRCPRLYAPPRPKADPRMLARSSKCRSEGRPTSLVRRVRRRAAVHGPSHRPALQALAQSPFW